MNVDKRAVRRRAWRIIGRWLWREVAQPALLMFGIAAFLMLGGWAWSYHPLLLIVPVAMVLIGLIGSLVWDNAKDKARDDMARDHLREMRRR